MALDARVYVDESYSVKDEVFYLAALIVPTECEAALEAAWNELRLEIKNEIRDYYGAQKHKDDPDWLPEIHAVKLYQSSDEYEKYERQDSKREQDKDYWIRHFDWLEKALAIQAKFDLPLIAIKGNSMMDPTIPKGNEFLDAMFKETWNSDILKSPKLENMLEKMKYLSTRPFTWFFPNLLLGIEYELANRSWQAEIVCDDDEESRGFRLSTMLKTFYESGILAHVKNVLFEDSKKRTGLQIVDVHAYILRRAEALKTGKIESPRLTDSRLEDWVAGISRQQIPNNKPVIEDRAAKTAPLIYEYVVMNCGGPIAWRLQIWESVREILKKYSPYLQ